MNKHKHRFMTFCSRAAMLLCSLVLVGLCVGSFSYIAYMGAGEAVQFLPITFSSRIYGVLALLGAGLALAWAAQYEEFRRWTTVIALCLVMAEAAFWLWATAPTPAADSMACLQAAANAIAGNWVDFQQGGYLYLFPYQIGLVALDEAMIRLFGWEGALAALRCLNLAALGLLAVSLTAIARRLFGSAAAMLTAVLLAASVPVARYVFFLYGNMLSNAFAYAAVWSALVYIDTRRWRSALLTAMLLALAMTAKATALIALAAIVIVLFLHTIWVRRWRELLAVVLILALAWLPGKALNAWYSERSGVPQNPGVSNLVYVAMGLDIQGASTMAPGWYTGRPVEAYAAAGYDPDVMNANQIESILGSVEYFVQHPDEAKAFFRDKMVSQWLDPGFGSWLYLSVHTTPRRCTEYLNTVYTQGYDQGLNQFLGFLQTAVYIAGLVGVLLLVVWGNPIRMLPALVFFGGFFYLTFSEGKSQYAISFYPMLLPIAALGLAGVMGLMLRAKGTRKNISPLKRGKNLIYPL